MFDSGEASGYDGNVWVGAFGGGGTDSLIGAAGTGIAFAREVRFWTGAMFCGWGGCVNMMDAGVWSGGEDIPGSGAMSLGSILGGSEGSIGMGSSSKGAMLVVLLDLGNHCRRVLVARCVRML